MLFSVFNSPQGSGLWVGEVLSSLYTPAEGPHLGIPPPLRISIFVFYASLFSAYNQRKQKKIEYGLSTHTHTLYLLNYPEFVSIYVSTCAHPPAALEACPCLALCAVPSISCSSCTGRSQIPREGSHARSYKPAPLRRLLCICVSMFTLIHLCADNSPADRQRII